MTDIDSQNPFIPQTPPGSRPPAASPTDRPKRRRTAKAEPANPARKPRQSSGIPLTAPAGEKGSKARKPRAAKKAAPAPAGKLDISTIVSAAVGLKEDEATVLLAIVQSLSHLKKSAKPKVLAALSRLFG